MVQGTVKAKKVQRGEEQVEAGRWKALGEEPVRATATEGAVGRGGAAVAQVERQKPASPLQRGITTHNNIGATGT